MSQEYDNLKQRAREQLRGHWLQAVSVCFIILLVTIVFDENSPVLIIRNICRGYMPLSGPSINPFSSLSQFIKFISIGQSVWDDLLVLIVMGPLTLGGAFFFLRLTRKENAEVTDVFKGFKYFGQAFILNLLIKVFMTLWSLLLVIPGIIAGLRYSMAYYILTDNPGLNSLEALNESKRMMMGHKFELFLLEFSFLGWFLLGAVTLGLALLWVEPYYEAVKANFYQELKADAL